MKLILKPNELILRAGNSVLYQDNKKIKGKLIVTNQTLYFKTLQEEYKKFNKEITEINEIFFFNILWLFPKGISIKTKKGDRINFSVNNRNKWTELITKMF